MLDKLESTGAQSLMEQTLPESTWIVDRLLTTGTVTILASRPKYGKSWLCMQLGHAVATGEDFLGRKTEKCGVAYLCLEDNLNRLQRRLWAIAEESSDDLRLILAASTLDGGLLDQLECHLQEHPGTRLVIIDTLQVTRDAGADYSYAADYADLRRYKRFADEHGVCVLLVHHLRKMESQGDSFADISGTTGISGAVDTMLVLKQKSRAERDCTLSVTGRDVEYAELVLARERCRWTLVEERGQEEIWEQQVPEDVLAVERFCRTLDGAWQGCSSTLIEQAHLQQTTSAVLGKHLAQHASFLESRGILYTLRRTSSQRIITLERTRTVTANDANDGTLPTTLAPSLPSLPSCTHSARNDFVHTSAPEGAAHEATLAGDTPAPRMPGLGDGHE